MNGVTRVAGSRRCTCGGLCLASHTIHCVCGVPHVMHRLHCVRLLTAWLRQLAEFCFTHPPALIWGCVVVVDFRNERSDKCWWKSAEVDMCLVRLIIRCGVSRTVMHSCGTCLHHSVHFPSVGSDSREFCCVRASWGSCFLLPWSEPMMVAGTEVSSSSFCVFPMTHGARL